MHEIPTTNTLIFILWSFSFLLWTESQSSSSRLVCVACKDAFSNPWDLMVHVQAAHMVNIYEIGDFDGDSDSNKGINGNSKSSKLDKTNGESPSNGASSCNGSVVHPNENVSCSAPLNTSASSWKIHTTRKLFESWELWRFSVFFSFWARENEKKSSFERQRCADGKLFF